MRFCTPILLLLLAALCLLPMACGKKTTEDPGICTPARPAASDALLFNFDLRADEYRLRDSMSVDLLYTMIDGRGDTFNGTLPLEKVADVWQGELHPGNLMPGDPVLMLCALLDRADPEIYDNRQGDPWLIIFHDGDKPVRDARRVQFQLLTGRLRLDDLLTLPKNPDLGGEVLASELKDYPDNHAAQRNLWGRELGLARDDQTRLDEVRAEAYQGVMDQLAVLEAAASSSDAKGPGDELQEILGMLSTLEHAAERDSIVPIWLERFPNGSFAEGYAYAQAMNAPSPGETITRLVDFARRFPNSDDAPYARGVAAYYGQLRKADPVAAAEIVDSGKEITGYLLQYYVNSIVEEGQLERGEVLLRRVIEETRVAVWSPTDEMPEHVWRRDNKMSIVGAMQNLAGVVEKREREAESLGLLNQLVLDHSDLVGAYVFREQLRLQRTLGREAEMEKTFALLARKAELTQAEKDEWRDLSGAEAEAFAANLADIREQARAESFTKLAAHALRFDAPAASFKDINGNVITLESLKGKAVLIDFWATWCGPCLRALPHINEIGRDYGHDGDLFIIAGNTWERSIGDERLAAVAAKWTELGMTIPYYLDAERGADGPHAVDGFGVTGIPSTFLLGPSGKLLFRKTGMGGEADVLDLRQKIDYALSLITES